ncbi:MAG: hypothetical protein JTJ23_12830 [Fusicatenibacter saccharivorans]|uniref:Uncharacterized protein n=1 Tax=Fusicatenibacter saccharivorans TaxID=1150298 RepID=A0A939CGP0_9FIRM|nr:hypothetical protein [Fusicatenibacter saccharivorans]CAI9752073.1 hypothetical protein MZNIZDYX_MZNIZDYX_CDS_0067 [uncultured phage]CAI9752219.1 hypothetical protein GCSOEBMH_GCSOEBMH_CDS_0067 [uncultured phage]DAG69975.1 MAG TPA: hypothetical protein [Caudoviricetes sp.]
MTRGELENIVADCCNDIIFTYNGKPSGVTSTVYNYIPTYQAWHGETVKEYNSVEDVMNDKFYSGKSINDLFDEVSFTFT